MESIIRLNHRNNTQLRDISNYINTIIGAKVISTYTENPTPSDNSSSKKDCLNDIRDLSKKLDRACKDEKYREQLKRNPS